MLNNYEHKLLLDRAERAEAECRSLLLRVEQLKGQRETLRRRLHHMPAVVKLAVRLREANAAVADVEGKIAAFGPSGNKGLLLMEAMVEAHAARSALADAVLKALLEK